MTKRLPRMSTTMVKMRKQPKVVVTQGGRFRTVSAGSGEELFRWDPFITIVLQPRNFHKRSQIEGKQRSGGSLGSGDAGGGVVLESPAAFILSPLLGARCGSLFGGAAAARRLRLKRPSSARCRLDVTSAPAVPFTLSVRMCVCVCVWHEAATSNLPSMWPNSQGRSAFYLQGETRPHAGGKWELQKLWARPTFSPFIHGFTLL